MKILQTKGTVRDGEIKIKVPQKLRNGEVEVIIQQTSRKVFLAFYLGGIFLAMFLGSLMIGYPEYTWFLLIEGILHILFLSIWGFSSKSSSFKIFAGERIQTAGYLHTLIGFSVAITLLGTGSISIEAKETWLAPMGSALVTSILGWLLGGEIAYKEDDSVDKAIEKIGEAFENLELKQVDVLEKYLNNLPRFSPQQNNISDQKIENLVITVQKNNQFIIEMLNQFRLIIKEESETLKQTFHQLNHAMENESESVPQSLKRLNSIIEDQSETLRYTFKQLNSVIEENSQSFSGNLKQLQTESKNAVNSMSDTTKSVQSIAEELQKMVILIQQLEKRIKYNNQK